MKKKNEEIFDKVCCNGRPFAYSMIIECMEQAVEARDEEIKEGIDNLKIACWSEEIETLNKVKQLIDETNS